MKTKLLSVHWRGPFTDEEFDTIDESSVLYLATGRTKGQRNDRIQYCGITEQSICHRKIRHPKLTQITTSRLVWIGWLVHSRRTTREDLELAEQILIYLWQMPLNERKKLRPPRPTSLISQWFEPDWRPYKQKPEIFRDLFDAICWDGTYWSTGFLERWKD